MKKLILLLSLFLVACGGGGGGSSNTETIPPPARTNLLYGYFGSIQNPTGINNPPVPGMPTTVGETGKHVNIVMTGSWGDWDSVQGRLNLMNQAITQMQEARSFGITKFIVSVDFLLYHAEKSRITYRGKNAATTDLIYFFSLIRNSGLLSDVVMVYPMDEPNGQPISVQDVETSFSDLRSFLSSNGDTSSIGLFVIYAPISHGTPGFTQLTWIGVDNYNSGTGVLNEIDSLRVSKQPSQLFVLVPGGAGPWYSDPSPYKVYADTHPDVVLIMPFVWFDYLPNKGIRSNPIRELYIRLGCLIRYGPNINCG